MNLSEAKQTANFVKEVLEPHCDQIEIAGSIRRESSMPNDIEIVCIPKIITAGPDLFGEPIAQRDPGFAKVVNKWKHIKGDAGAGLYMQRAIIEEGESEIKLDIFTARPENWGVILAIRTGPEAFSHYCLASRAQRFGMRIQGGMLTQDGETIPCPTEKYLLGYLGMPWIPPHERGLKRTLDRYGVF